MADDTSTVDNEMDMAAAMADMGGGGDDDMAAAMAEMEGSGGDDDMAAAMAEMEGGGGDDDMAAAMGGGGDMAADMGGGGDMAAVMGGDDSSLSQDEIDSLLGFDGGNTVSTQGIQALLDRSNENYERLPMLEVVYDRFVRSVSTSLRNFTSDNVDVNIDSITSMRFEDYLNSVPLPALLAIFHAVEWENFGILTIDSSLTYSMVDVLLGGGRVHRPIRIEGRPFTTIEQDIVQSITHIILDELAAAFNPLTPATFRMDRLETNPRFATITLPSNPVILTTLRVEMEDRGGKLDVLFPYVTLDPIKRLLLQMFSGESFGADVSWERYLSGEISNTDITIAATLPPKTISLKDLSRLAIGSTIVTDSKPTDLIDVRCKGIPVLGGKLGTNGKNLAIQVENVNAKQLKDIDSLL